MPMDEVCDSSTMPQLHGISLQQRSDPQQPVDSKALNSYSCFCSAQVIIPKHPEKNTVPTLETSVRQAAVVSKKGQHKAARKYSINIDLTCGWWRTDLCPPGYRSPGISSLR